MIMKNRFLRLVAVVFIIVTAGFQRAGAAVADRIVAVVGNEMIMQSQVDEQAMMARLQYTEAKNDPSLKAGILENLVTRKIVLTKARIDSIQVDESDIEKRTDERMRFLRSKFSSIEEMESTFSKSYAVIEKEIKDDIRDQQLINNLRRQKMMGVNVTYEEVEEFYGANRDKLPVVPEAVEVSQVVMYPKVTAEAKAKARAAIEAMQQRLRSGENFAALAREYSQDPGSARLGGDLGYSRRGEFVKNYEKVAFGLEEGEISGIVETRFGYHIIQLLDKEQDAVHTRHILIVFDRSTLDAPAAKTALEMIRSDIISGKSDFAEMAREYSDDPVSSKFGGVIRNTETGETRFAVSALRDQLKTVVRSFKKVGDISSVVRVAPESGAPFYAIFRLNSREPAHKLGLSSDYARLEKLAIDEKQNRLFQEWINELQKEVYVRISDI
ncbi:MAG: peptidylprolyl isomerase [Prosthecochloris sp.]|nr:peptidylprolyl isomerase [Prosthecochloris sp.]